MDSEILTKLTLLFVAIAQLFMVLICIFALRRYQDLVSVIFDKLELLEDIIQKDNSTLGFFDSTSKSIDSKSEKNPLVLAASAKKLLSLLILSSNQKLLLRRLRHSKNF